MADFSRAARTNGNPNERDTDREASRLGRQRTPDDIPKQDVKTAAGVLPGNVDPNNFEPSTNETKGVYRLGLRGRPPIVHDNGHLALGMRSPTAGDHLALAKWRAMLLTGEALRPDLTDALAAYRHFLDGQGRPRTFSYDRYVINDWSGQVTLRNAILEFQQAALGLWGLAERPSSFQISGPAIPCGAKPIKYPYLSSHFPYPVSENWQKAIGSHYTC